MISETIDLSKNVPTNVLLAGIFEQLLILNSGGNNLERQYMPFTADGDAFRIGIRGGKLVKDLRITADPGFDGVEGVDWENLGTL